MKKKQAAPPNCNSLGAIVKLLNHDKIEASLEKGTGGHYTLSLSLVDYIADDLLNILENEDIQWEKHLNIDYDKETDLSTYTLNYQINPSKLRLGHLKSDEFKNLVLSKNSDVNFKIAILDVIKLVISRVKSSNATSKFVPKINKILTTIQDDIKTLPKNSNRRQSFLNLQNAMKQHGKNFRPKWSLTAEQKQSHDEMLSEWSHIESKVKSSRKKQCYAICESPYEGKSLIIYKVKKPSGSGYFSEYDIGRKLQNEKDIPKFLKKMHLNEKNELRPPTSTQAKEDEKSAKGEQSARR